MATQCIEGRKAEMMPVPATFYGCVECGVRISSTCLVSNARSRYSIPCAHAGARVSVRLYPERAAVIADDAVIAAHARAGERGHVVFEWFHYEPLLQRKPGALRNGAPFVDLPKSLVQLKRLLLRRPGGDHIMVKVLALIPEAGQKTVLVAVELANTLEPVKVAGKTGKLAHQLMHLDLVILE